MILTLMTFVAEAQQVLVDVVPECAFDCNFSNLKELVNNYISLLIQVATYIFLIGVVWIGVSFVTRGGSSEERQKAKGTLISLLIGYVLLLGAFLAIDLVFTVFNTKTGGLQNSINSVDQFKGATDKTKGRSKGGRSNLPTSSGDGTEAAKAAAAKTEAAKTEAAKTEAAKTEAAKAEEAKKATEDVIEFNNNRIEAAKAEAEAAKAAAAKKATEDVIEFNNNRIEAAKAEAAKAEAEAAAASAKKEKETP